MSDFLEFARPAQPRLEAVQLEPLCREVAELARAGAAARVDVEVAASVWARADRAQLRRVLLNLARNAVAAARSRVQLAARAEGGRVRVEVRDDGVGVPPELRDQIFTPFFTTREKGTGLGLAFVREIVRDHGGEVGVRDADGGGSVFSFDLPGGDQPAAAR